MVQNVISTRLRVPKRTSRLDDDAAVAEHVAADQIRQVRHG